MKNILVLAPLVLLIYATIESVVERRFVQEAITLNTGLFKEQTKPKLALSVKKPQLPSRAKSFEDVRQLDFTQSHLKLEKEVVENKILLVKENPILVKKIEKYNLKKRNFEFRPNYIKRSKINQSIVELNLKEPVFVGAYKKIKIIKKTNWSSLLEYSPAKTIEKNSENEDLILPVIARVEEKVKKKYYENLKTPIIKSQKKIIKIKEPTDRISTQLAATEKSIVEKPALSQITKSKSEQKVLETKKDDLVFFDYSAAEKDLNTQNEKSRSLVKMAQFLSEQKRIKMDQKKAIVKIAQGGPMGPQKINAPIGPEDKTVNAKKNNINYFSEYSIQPYSVSSKSMGQSVMNFEVRFDDDIDDIKQSFGEGEIKLSERINNNMMVRRGTLFAASYYPVTVDFVLENNEVVAKIPMLEKDFLNNLIQTQHITGLGGQILVELDDLTEDVEIDINYERKIFLDKNFNVVERAESDYSFVMFLGVGPGNTIISFKTSTKETINKIIHISDEEIYYEPNFYIQLESDTFSLNEEYLLSRERGPLSLDPQKIAGLTFTNTFKKLTTNKYEANKTKYSLGTRSYLELKHLDESIFLGRWNNENIVVPSEQYMRFVLDKFRINNMESHCLVQLNLAKPANELFFNGQSKQGAMRMQVKILDKDGVFYSDLSNESQKIFLLGEEQGIINIKVKYTDNSYEYLQSYCSDSTYLVEQL